MFDWRKRSKPSFSMDPIAEAKLDEALNELGQQFIAQSVKRLSNEDVSLVWRSRLNEALVVEQSKAQKTRRVRLIWRPISGFAAASVCAFVLISNQATIDPPRSSARLEADVIHAHVLAQRSYELTGSSVVTDETDIEAIPASFDYQWEEADLGAL